MAATHSQLIVETAGATRGDPGPAAYAAVVRDMRTGALLAEVADSLGIQTTAFAQYSGVVAGLKAAARVNPDARVEVRLGSARVLEHLTGRRSLRDEALRELAAQVAALTPGSQARYTHVQRAQNKRAWALANQSLDAALAERPARIWQFFEEEHDTDMLATAAGQVEADARAEAAEHAERAASARAVPNRIIGWAPDLDQPTRLLAVRHGVTQHSIEHRFSGLGGIDPPLLELGRRQAQAVSIELAARGGADIVVCSPLLRARQTAAIIAGHLRLAAPEAVDDLAEASFGEWDGLTFAQVKQRYPDELTAWLASPDVPAPGGEPYSALRHRVTRARKELVARYPGMRVVIVAHVSPIKALVQGVLEAPSASAFRIELAPCSLTTLAFWADGGATIYGVGESGHLHDLFPRQG